MEAWVGVVGALLGVVLGAILSQFVDKTAFRRSEAALSRAALVQSRNALWADAERTFVHLESEVALVMSRCASLGIPEELLWNFHGCAVDSWQAGHDSMALHGAPTAEIPDDLIVEFDLAAQEIDRLLHEIIQHWRTKPRVMKLRRPSALRRWSAPVRHALLIRKLIRHGIAEAYAHQLANASYPDVEPPWKPPVVPKDAVHYVIEAFLRENAYSEEGMMSVIFADPSPEVVSGTEN